MGFVENVIVFRTVQNCENRLTFDKVITDYCNVLFLWTTVILLHFDRIK